MTNRIAIVALAAAVTVAPSARAQAPGTTPRVRAQLAAASDPNAPPAIVLGRFEACRPADSAVSSVYGNPLAFGGELRLRATRQIYASMGFGYIGKTGQLTVTREPTTLTMYPVEGMVLFYVAPGRISPYVGGGGTAYHYAETNVIGSVSQWAFGYVVAGGLTMHASRVVAIDARLKYSNVKDTPAESQVNLGGLTVGIGAGIKF